jgi:hypothetical protein
MKIAILSMCVLMGGFLPDLAFAYMPPKQAVEYAFSEGYRQYPTKVKSLYRNGQISKDTYRQLMDFHTQEKEIVRRLAPQLHEDLLNAARSVAPDPSAPLDKSVRSAAKAIAQARYETEVPAIAQEVRQKYNISPLISDAWAIVLQARFEARDRDFAVKQEQVARTSKRIEQMQKDLAKRAAQSSDPDDILRRLELISGRRSPERGEAPRYNSRSRQLSSMTITPAAGGSFYASDPDAPGGVIFYQKRGNTYYYKDSNAGGLRSATIRGDTIYFGGGSRSSLTDDILSGVWD